MGHIHRGIATKLESEKLGKACLDTIAQLDGLKALNHEIVTQTEAHQKGAQASKKQLGKALILGPEVLEELQANAKQKRDLKKAKQREQKFSAALKDIHHLWKLPKPPKPLKRSELAALTETVAAAIEKVTITETPAAPAALPPPPPSPPAVLLPPGTPAKVVRSRSGRVCKPKNRA